MFEEKHFSNGIQGIAFILKEALLSTKFLQTKLHVQNRIINLLDLFYTIIRNLSDEGGERWGLG